VNVMADDTTAPTALDNIAATLAHCERARSGWQAKPVPTAPELLLRARVLSSHHRLDQQTGLIIAWNDVRNQLTMQIEALDRSGRLALQELQAWEAIDAERKAGRA